MHDLLTEYLNDARDRIGWSTATLKAYGSHLRLVIGWLTGRLGRVPEPADYTADAIQTYDTSRKRAGLAQRTRAAGMSAFQSFARFLHVRRLISADQCQQIERGLHVKVTEKPRQKWASSEQVQAMFAACEDVAAQHGALLAYRQPLAAAVLSCLAYGGLRCGEVCRLATADVDLLAPIPTLTVRQGKGDKTRVVWLHPQAARYIKAWLEHRPIDDPQLFACPIYRIGQPVRATAFRECRLEGLLRELCQIAQIMDRSVLAPHAFRRFAATKLLEVPGCTLAHVRDFLGHSSIQTTIVYIGMEVAQLQGFIAKMQVEAPVPEHILQKRGTPRKPKQMPPATVRRAAFRRT